MPSQQGEPPSGGINWQAVIAIAAVVSAIAAAVVAFKPFSSGGKSHSSTTKIKTPVRPPETETPTSTPETTPIAASPTKVCQKELTLEGFASYSLDECKADRNGTVNLFVVHEKVFGATKVVEWTGHGAPSISDCISGTGASGVESVKLKRVGQWLCAEGSEHHVIRIRFDSFTPPMHIGEGGIYKFFVDVYESGGG